MGNVSYLTVNDNKVNYFSRNETPLALSNISKNAAELRFSLEESKSSSEILKLCKKELTYAKTVELI